MNRMMILLAVLTSFLSIEMAALNNSTSSSSSVTTHNDPIGEFTILATAKRHGVILSNNVAYEPTNHKGKKILHKWELHDPVRLLYGDGHGRFVLINLRTGQSIRAKILDYISSDDTSSS